MAAATKPKSKTNNEPSFTLEEIDNYLTSLTNIRKHSVSANKKAIDKRIDLWLDRRLELQEAGDK